MGNFLITGPDGKKYKVGGDTPEGALQALQQHLGGVTPAKAPPGIGPEPEALPASDFIKNLPGDAYEAGANIVQGAMHPQASIEGVGDLIGGYLARSPIPRPDWLGDTRTPEDHARQAETADAFDQMLEERWSTPTRAWNTVVENPADTLLTFAPGVGALGKAAKVSGMARTAGALDKAAEFTNPVNLVKKPIAAALPNSFGRGNRLKQAIKTIPDADAALASTKQQAKTLWKGIEDQDIQFPAETFKPFAANIEDNFRGLDSEVAPQASALKNSIKRALAGDAPKATTEKNMWGHTVHKPAPRDDRAVSFNTLDNIRRTASEMSVDAKLSNTEQAGAKKILKGLEEYYDTVPGLNETLGPAKEMSRRKILAEKLSKMRDKSEWYLGGDESGLKNQVSAFGKAHGHTLTPEERKMFQSVVKKEGVNNFLTTAGGRLGQLMLGGVGATLGGWPGVIGAGVGHALARKASEKITKSAIDDAMKTVLLGKQKQIATRKKSRRDPPVNDKAMIKALIAGNAAGALEFPRDRQ